MITVQGFKDHMQFEDGMDDSMLSFYLEQGKIYAKRATGSEESIIAYFIASLFFEFKVPESEMANAFNALTPLILQEGLVKEDGQAPTKPIEVDSGAADNQK